MRPCSDCPWRRDSLPGWLGEATPDNSTPEEWIRIAHAEFLLECHVISNMQCAGAAIYRRNICKLPRDKNLLTLPADREKVFAMPKQFLEHHRGK